MRTAIQNLILFSLFISYQCVSAQYWSIDAGMGIGLKFPSNSEDRRDGLGLHLGLAYQFNDKWSISLAYQTFGTGTFWSGDFPNFSNDTTDTFEFNKTNSNLWMLNPRYFFNSNKVDTSFLVGLAFGIQQIVRDINVNGQKTLSKSVLTIAPEIGYSIDDVNFALRWYPIQETPAFETTDQRDGRRKVFEPVKFSLVTLHVTYSFKLSKKGSRKPSD